MSRHAGTNREHLASEFRNILAKVLPGEKVADVSVRVELDGDGDEYWRFVAIFHTYPEGGISPDVSWAIADHLLTVLAAGQDERSPIVAFTTLADVSHTAGAE